jgi:hypothetical protein
VSLIALGIVYIIMMFLTACIAAIRATDEVELYRKELKEFKERVEANGQVMPPQNPPGISMVVIFWSGLLWPAYLVHLIAELFIASRK